MRALVVDLDLLRENIRAIRAEVEVPIYGVCKGNGFGTGLEVFAATLLEQGVERLAVASVEDAVRLRESGVDGEILLLSSTALPEEARQIAQYSLTAAAGSIAAAVALERAAIAAGKTLPVHLKLDTGFGRFGFLPGQEAQAVQALERAPHLRVEGVFSHFSRSFSTADTTARQLSTFLQMLEELRALGLNPPLRHIANSCAALLHPDTRLDAVRIGSAFVGRLPMASPIPLHRIGEFVCEVAELHELPGGHNVGYTNVYTTKRPTTAAVLTAGVADGLGHVRGKDAFRPYDRLRYIWHAVKGLRGNPALRCTIGGRSVPTLGRIGLTNTIVDVTGMQVAPGDLAVFDINPMFVDGSVPRRYK